MDSRRRTLTEELVFMRTKCNRLDMIRNLNLWGNDLSNVGVLRDMPNLEVLSLSVNSVGTLVDLPSLTKLRELYLRKNDIRDLAEVQHLVNLRHLRVLWLNDNPCATLPHYRQYVLRHLPNLMKLDSQDVTEEERRRAQMLDLAEVSTCSDLEPSLEDSLETIMEMRKPSGEGSFNVVGPAMKGVGEYDGPVANPVAFVCHGGNYDALGSKLRSANSLPSMEIPNAGHGQNPVDAIVYGGMSNPGSYDQSSTSMHMEVRGGGGFHGKHIRCPQPLADGQRTSQGMPGNMNERAARADNILCAVLALIKELDRQGLELVRRAIEQRQGEL